MKETVSELVRVCPIFSTVYIFLLISSSSSETKYNLNSSTSADKMINYYKGLETLNRVVV